MIKHTFFSLIKDLKSFLGMSKKRLDEIEKAPDTPVEGIYGANILADELHMEDAEVEVIKKEAAQFGSFISIKEINGKALPPFAAGQYIIVKPGVVGVRTSVAFYIVSSSDGIYKIFVPQSDDSDISAFAASDLGARYKISAPHGYCRYMRLRDRSNLFICTDKQGFGAGESFRENEIPGVSSKIYTFFGKSFEPEDDNPQLSVFLREAKSSDGSLFIYGSEDFVNKMRKVASDAGFIKKTVRYDILTPAPKLRYGDRKYICRIKNGEDCREIVVSSDITLAKSLELAGVNAHVKCMSGECGYCRIKLTEGQVITKYADGEEHLRRADIADGYIHPCRCYPKSDITVIM